MEDASGAILGETLLAEDPAAVKAEEKPDKTAASQPLVCMCGPLPSLFRGFLPGLPMTFRFLGDICH
jgi:hypothetical protein